MSLLKTSSWHQQLMQLAYLFPGDAAGEFTKAPSTCPGDTFTFRCTVVGDMSGVTLWRVGSSNNLCTLAFLSNDSATCGPNEGSHAFTAMSGVGFGTSGPLYSSILTGTAATELDGTLVECFGPDSTQLDSKNRVGGSTIHILGK